jgi:hypothetical protein
VRIKVLTVREAVVPSASVSLAMVPEPPLALKVTLTVGALGVTRLDPVDLGPTSNLFLATTVNAYDVPLLSPEIVHLVADVVHVLPFGCEVAT